MARKRMTRRELVEKDEITTKLQEVVSFLIRNRNLVLAGVGVVLAVVVIAVGWSVYASNREAASQTELSRVIAIFGDVEGYASDADRFQAAVVEAELVSAAYPSLSAGRIAQYYVALSQGGLGNTTESVRILNELVESGYSTIAEVARFALAESYTSTGELESAIAAYQGLVESGGYSQGAVLYELGRLHEAISKPDEARGFYESVIGEYPDSPFRAEADRALERLGSEESPADSTASEASP